ncbi:hypothetical protein J437_LFUL010386 [Ladona fulva]|uniref:Uncharacterized protein n=1 Tax=Ladona fulva TaxID=123851 RepID=A0A8K0P646_LADFU|nr:hypothetical protein J437_LFUL010386 [Ladona fulva]
MAAEVADQFESRLHISKTTTSGRPGSPGTTTTTKTTLVTKTVGEDRVKSAKEKKEDVAILSSVIPGDESTRVGFRCALGDKCLQGNCREIAAGKRGVPMTRIFVVFAIYGKIVGQTLI